MFGYFLPAFLARVFAADFCEDVRVLDFFLGFFFSQIGLLATLLPCRLLLRSLLRGRLALRRVSVLLTINHWHNYILSERVVLRLCIDCFVAKS